jgi:hypothetical protein
MAPTDAEAGRSARFSHIFARLTELPNYVWDPELEPFHSVSCNRLEPCAKLIADIVLRQLALFWLPEGRPR